MTKELASELAPPRAPEPPFRTKRYQIKKPTNATIASTTSTANKVRSIYRSIDNRLLGDCAPPMTIAAMTPPESTSPAVLLLPVADAVPAADAVAG